MTTLKAKTDAQIEKSRQAKPEFMQALDDLMINAREFKQGESALKLSEQAPEFSLANANGEPVALSDILSKGPAVITFYRGSWCPYCNLQLRALHARLPEIREHGAELIAISTEKPDDSLSQKEINELEFIVLSDENAQTAEKFGVAWQVPQLLIDHMKNDRNLDLEQVNNGSGNVLSIPATFIIGTDGIIKWRYVNIDYRTRSEPEDIVTALAKL